MLNGTYQMYTPFLMLVSPPLFHYMYLPPLQIWDKAEEVPAILPIGSTPFHWNPSFFHSLLPITYLTSRRTFHPANSTFTANPVTGKNSQ